MDDVSDIIYLYSSAESTLQIMLLTRCLGKPVHDPCQHKQVLPGGGKRSGLRTS